MKLNTTKSKRLAATGILALGAGSYQLMAQTVLPCAYGTASFCAGLCAQAGSTETACQVYLPDLLFFVTARMGRYSTCTRSALLVPDRFDS